jgi:hypothetical protein
MAAAAAAGIAAGLFGVLPAAAASAASPAVARDGVCDPGEFCYYWGSGETGSLSDFTVSVGNYGTTEPSCFDFKGPGFGQGQCIKNNAESVWNHSSRSVTVFFNSGFTGPSETFLPGEVKDLDPVLFNNNASHQFN